MPKVKKKTAKSTKKKPATTKIDCGDSVDITMAKQWKEKLLKALELEKPIVLQAKKLARIDTAGLQLMSVFIQNAKAEGLAVEWKDASPALINAAKLTGLLNTLNLKEVK